MCNYIRLIFIIDQAHALSREGINDQEGEKAKVKKKLTPAQKRARRKAKAERQRKYMWVFMTGKQVRVKRPPTIDGLSVDEFSQRNADPIWLHQNEMWEYMEPTSGSDWTDQNAAREKIETERVETDLDDKDLPF